MYIISSLFQQNKATSIITGRIKRLEIFSFRITLRSDNLSHEATLDMASQLRTELLKLWLVITICNVLRLDPCKVTAPEGNIGDSVHLP